MRCCVVFCLMVVCFEFGIVDSLKSSQKGVCVSKHTVTKTRPRTVLVQTSKWCGTKKCTVRQTRKQKYTVVTNQLMCCKGFVYISSTDSCAPICSTGCANGTCTDPDVCHCAAPLYLDPTTKNKCLSPTCDHPCINGECTVNNTCACREGYVYYNATHCAENCTAGFELVSLNCIPKCRCVGNCSCVCEPGAVNGTCQCGPCDNGRCVGQKCVCDEGFVEKNGVCQLSCGGECRANGTCVASVAKTRYVNVTVEVLCSGRSGTCYETQTKKERYTVIKEVCCDQYYLDTKLGKCQPRCEKGCANGTCTAPNICECDGLLVLNKTVIPNTCTSPVCDTPCRHGTCTASNTCTCLDGYIPKDNSTCVPNCTNCTNGDCVSPNVCNCHEGYSKRDEICTPQCDECNNGICSAPNVCTCNVGYERKDNKCQPKCTNLCVNGDCVAPDTCQCKKGYEAKNGNNDHCIPKCKNDCSNGLCLEPDICSCNSGFKNEDNTCKPVCKEACLHGDCVAPNICKCYEGYEKKDHTEKCIPVCETGCSYGWCSAPGLCECNPGYELKDNKCKPVCEKSCINGNCVAPNNCECLDGFERVDKENCRPKCNKGYSRTDKGCEPTCNETCVNGYCSAPNECSCNSGYTKDSLKSFVCRNPCDVSCKTCDDGKCICEPDMDFINGTCVVAMPPGEESMGVTSTGLASVQMTWWVGGAVVLLLTVLVLAVISRLWYTRKNFPQKAADDGPYGSVAYTVPNTLFRKNDLAEDEETSDTLMEKETNIV